MPEGQSEGFSNRPVHTIRVGNVHASIWRNNGENGDFFNATYEIRYEKEGEWKTGKNYGPVDSLCLQKAASLASTYMLEQLQAKGRGRSAA